MNIFYTSRDPIISARSLCNVHVNKMILESAQMLSTAHHVIDGQTAIRGLMKATHVNHPSNIWVRSSTQHYEWLLDHLIELLKIFELRSGKIHAVSMRIPFLANFPKGLVDNGFVDPPRAMSEEFKFDESISTEVAYQKYLNSKYAEWQTRERPIKIVFYHAEPMWYNC